MPHSHSQDRTDRGFRTLLALACLIVVLAGMKAAAGFLVPIAFGFFLAVLSYPLVRLLVKWHLPRVVALGITIMLNIAAVVGMGKIAVDLIIAFQQDIPSYIKAVEQQVNLAAKFLQERGVEGAVEATQGMLDWNGIVSYLSQQNVMTNIGSLLGSTFGTVAMVFASMVMVFLVMIFILMEAHGTHGRFAAVKLAGGPSLDMLLQSVSDIQQYLGVKTLISALTGIMAGLACWMFGLKYPLLWAIMAFVFNFIPAVGSSAASIPAIIEALVQDGWGSALGIAIGYGGINFVLDNFVQPALIGRRFGISPLVIILSVIFWGWLWGPVGMFLAVPLTMVFKVMLDNSHEFRWLAVAMSKKKVTSNGEVQLPMYDFDPEDLESLGGGAATEVPRDKD
jgi:predicted PurR-regulated permease PerM